jgi:hypothetical protein
LPLLIDAGAWQRTVIPPRGDRPVLGHDVRDAAAGRRAALLAVYPRTTMDVRLRAAHDSPAHLLLKRGLPASWLVYAEADLSARDFLHQLDFYVGFPPPDAVEVLGRPTLEALAVGCVTVLPHRLAGAYGDAAVYCEPHQVPEVVRRYWADPQAYAAQSQSARRWARQHFTPDGYADEVLALLGTRIDAVTA